MKPETEDILTVKLGAIVVLVQHLSNIIVITKIVRILVSYETRLNRKPTFIINQHLCYTFLNFNNVLSSLHTANKIKLSVLMKETNSSD